MTPCKLVLRMSFDKLFQRIDRRVDLRFEYGYDRRGGGPLLEMGVSHKRLEDFGLEIIIILVSI